MSEPPEYTGPRRVTIDTDEADRRLDNFLLAQLRGVPRSRIYRMIRSGEVRVNRRRAKPGQRLASGDEVRIPPVRQAARGQLPAAPAGSGLQAHIIYEDRDVLVINKPSGLAVHGGSGISFGVIELLRSAASGHDKLELIHRLDRDTSGCLLVAKRRAALRHVQAQFRDGEVEKRYCALLLGKFPGPERVCDAPLYTHERRGGERHVRVEPDGKPALTWFRRLAGNKHATLTDITLKTGRTHQIRVHAAHLGHPVAGDSRYGPDDDIIVRRFGLKRLFLHAASLAFDSPTTGHVIRVRAPLDAELISALQRIDPAMAQSAGQPD